MDFVSWGLRDIFTNTYLGGYVHGPTDVLRYPVDVVYSIDVD